MTSLHAPYKKLNFSSMVVGELGYGTLRSLLEVAGDLGNSYSWLVALLTTGAAYIGADRETIGRNTAFQVTLGMYNERKATSP